VRYQGSLDCPVPIHQSTCGVLKTICNGYKEGKVVKACISDEGCQVGVTRDECNVCGGNGKVDQCKMCMPEDDPKFGKSCTDCAGVPFGTKTEDCFGTCLEPKDKNRKVIDGCGRCLAPPKQGQHSSVFNKTCLGCDGVMNSGKLVDSCGTCGGKIMDPSLCPTKPSSGSSGISVGGVIGIVIASTVVLCGLGYFYLRQQKTEWAHQLQDILKQYEPLGNENGSRSIGGVNNEALLSVGHPTSEGKISVLDEPGAYSPQDLPDAERV